MHIIKLKKNTKILLLMVLSVMANQFIKQQYNIYIYI